MTRNRMEGKMEQELRGLQARGIALGRRLDELKDRLNRGRISDGQYTDLAADLDRERIEILLEVQSMLQGNDEDIDAIMRDAINGEDEAILMGRLGPVAEKKGLGQRMVEEMKQRKGTILSWLVETGVKIARDATLG